MFVDLGPGAACGDENLTQQSLERIIGYAKNWCKTWLSRRPRLESAYLRTAQQEEAWVNTALLQVAEAVNSLTDLTEDPRHHRSPGSAAGRRRFGVCPRLG